MASLRGQHLHFEPTSGIAGDMAVAALVDLGVPPAIVGDAVGAMGVPGLRVTFEARRRGAYVGKGFVVHAPPTGRLRAGGSRPRKLGHTTGAELSQTEQHRHDHDHDHDHDAPSRPQPRPRPRPRVSAFAAARPRRWACKPPRA